MSLLNSKLTWTYKSRDTEEFIDKLFYRRVGYLMALASQKAGLTPNAITYLSIVVGVLSGHFFYYQNIYLNLVGVLLLIIAEAMDSADGQLARITNNYSDYGRILDGFGGNLWFVSIYIHICLRFIAEGGTPWVFLLAVVAGASHSLQSAMADYYRNFYFYFVMHPDKSEIERSEEIKERYNKLSWKKDFGKKFLDRFYINYTKEQEAFAKKNLKLLDLTGEKFGKELPEWLSSKYRELHKPLIKWYNILTTNFRMMILFIAVLSGELLIYFYFELTLLNILLVYVIIKKENNAKILIDKIKLKTE